MWLLTTLGNYPCLSVGFLPGAYILHKNRIVRLQFQIIKWNDMDVKKNLWNYSEPCEMEEKSRIMFTWMSYFSGISYGEKQHRDVA